jgi:predicted dehydrogenase
METRNIDFNIGPVMPERRDFRIGCIGAGFIMSDCHLVAYKDAGFNPQAITSLSLEESKAVATRHHIPKVYKSWKELIIDSEIEIVDIAIPPDAQLRVIRELVKQNDHIKGVLCQKPLAMNYYEANMIVELCEEAGIKLGVNSNMRYDQSIRALKSILNQNFIGDPVLATIEMRAIPHWQEFLKKYDRIEILNMGIHHIDSFRYLFGNPERITALTRKDPRTSFNHIDGISQYTFQYANGFLATSLDDVWAWPGEGTEKDIYIKWRVEGMDGMAQGTIGWPKYPVPTPSTLEFTSRHFPGQWIRPRWDKVWFPDAFQGTMAQLLVSVENNSEPEISGRDNLTTMAIVDACYKSIKEQRTIHLSEIINKIQEETL